MHEMIYDAIICIICSYLSFIFSHSFILMIYFVDTFFICMFAQTGCLSKSSCKFFSPPTNVLFDSGNTSFI